MLALSEQFQRGDLIMPLPIDKIPFCLATNKRLDRWVRIHADGTVTVLTGKVAWPPSKL